VIEEPEIIDELLSLTEEEQDDLVEAEAIAATVRYTAQDFDVNGLVRRLTSEDILVPSFGHLDHRIMSAGFQRGFVWTRSQMDRFIESLLLGYPIPGIFLVRQQDRRYLVLDGQQRLRTLAFFVDGVHDGKEFSLKNAAKSLQDLTYKSLSDQQRRQFDDTFIQATIVSPDGSEESLEAVYQIFERLNSGGTPLTAHEIRVALFAGQFIDYLQELNSLPDWREIYGRPSPRLRDQELILRIVALYLDSDSYHRPQKAFLNKVALRYRSRLPDHEVKSLFEASANLLKQCGRQVVRLQGSQVTAGYAEAVFVGLMRRLKSGPALSVADLTTALTNLRASDQLVAASSRSTAAEESVRLRLNMATDELSRA
jgi:Protein of unknown function DUF262